MNYAGSYPLEEDRDEATTVNNSTQPAHECAKIDVSLKAISNVWEVSAPFDTYINIYLDSLVYLLVDVRSNRRLSLFIR